MSGSQAYHRLQGLTDETEEPTPKPLTEHLKSVNTVKLFALMSIFVGFAVNTAFPASAPAPTPTVTPPSDTGSAHVWRILADQNQSVIPQAHGSTSGHPVMSSSVLGDVSLSLFNPGATALSIPSSPNAKSLSVPSSASKALSEVPTTSKCTQCKLTTSAPSSSASSSSSIKAKTTTTDVVLRPSTATVALSANTQIKTPLSLTTHSKASSGTILEALAGPSNPKPTPTSTSTTSPPYFNAEAVVNTVSEVLDAGAKAIVDVMATEVPELLDATNVFYNSIRTQTDKVIQHSKGKAREVHEEFHNANGRAKRRAKDLKEKGEKLFAQAGEHFRDRTVRAKKRARDISQNVLDSEAWQMYQRAQEEWEGTLTRREKRKQKKARRKAAQDDKENVNTGSDSGSAKHGRGAGPNKRRGASRGQSPCGAQAAQEGGFAQAQAGFKFNFGF